MGTVRKLNIQLSDGSFAVRELFMSICILVVRFLFACKCVSSGRIRASSLGKGWGRFGINVVSFFDSVDDQFGISRG